jgi:rubrerythrin
MLTNDKLLLDMLRKPFREVRAAFIARARIESKRKNFAQQMFEQEYEEVEDNGDAITADGREIVRVQGGAYALRPDVHVERLAVAFEAAKKAHPEPETKSVVGTESLSAMACPKCGDALQHTSVCPSCAAGKLGYRHRYTCVCGGVDLISKEML